MDSTSTRRPLRDALAALTASDQSDTELRELLSWMGDGSTPTALSTERGEEEVWELAAAEEDSIVSVEWFQTTL